jgi:asparagine synthase (glutamine-hydrolysing)
MCGIAGKVYADRERKVDEGLLRAMGQAMVHRGPDDEGYYLGGQAGLCMRRLKIIDLEGGHQPMSNEDGSLWVVFNGEVYNYRELRKDLEARGHVFRTNSDTETILHLYEEKGIECVQGLRGMFAFALWDSREGELVLARDRLGKKPLYYADLGGSLVFASELRTLLCDQEVERRLDLRAIDEYLTYLFVPHPRTLYGQVRKLPPASWARYRGGGLRIGRYWGVRYEPRARRLEEAVEELDQRLRQAVEMRLLADVPVGAFLSGGLDSSLVVALMRQVSGQPVRTFSIGFAESSFDELAYARQVARALGTEHQECVVGYQVRELVPKLLEHFGEPFADSSAIPLYHLSRMTRQHVSVALSGDGGDEVFGGYRRYRARRWAEWYNRWPAWAGRPFFEWGMARLGEPAEYYGKSLRKRTRRFLEFARAVRQAPETSWAFFLTGRKKTGCMRKILPILLVRTRRNPAWPGISPNRSTPRTRACCGSI